MMPFASDPQLQQPEVSATLLVDIIDKRWMER